MVLFKGIECSILSEGSFPTDVPLNIAGHFDIVIASVHTLPSLFKFKSREQVTEKMIEAMNDPVDIIGHPYLKSGCPDFEPLVKAAAEKGIALELNNYAIELRKAFREDALTMLQVARKCECRISLGSDSHMNNELGMDREIKSLLKETDFPDELIVNTSLMKASAFVKERKKHRAELMQQYLSLSERYS